jgi:hypothetical protein
MALLSAAGLTSPNLVALVRADLSNETPMGSLPDRRDMRARAVALFGSLGFSYVRLAAGYYAARPWTCFCRMPKSSMFADMPLDNRTVDQLAACHRLVLGPCWATWKRHRRSKRSIISLRMIVL